MNTCRICRENIIGMHVSTDAYKYHQGCFNCCHCLQPFKGDSYVEGDEGFYCESDYYLLKTYQLI
jgi:hypothetical protein